MMISVSKGPDLVKNLSFHNPTQTNCYSGNCAETCRSVLSASREIVLLGTMFMADTTIKQPFEKLLPLSLSLAMEFID